MVLIQLKLQMLIAFGANAIHKGYHQYASSTVNKHCTRKSIFVNHTLYIYYIFPPHAFHADPYN